MKNGFTLIEIMITLVIIGLLASMAYPSYITYITHIRRHAGQIELFNLANKLEEHYMRKRTYKTADINLIQSIATQWYTFNIVQQTTTTYLLQATPKNFQAINDINCQSLTLNHQGKKNITNGPYGSPRWLAEQCWDIV